MNIPFAALGFSIAAVAGLTLALIGHPEAQLPTPSAPAPAASSAPGAFVLKSVSVELPPGDATFPGKTNAEAINANCLACHSAGMVLTQPALSKTAWTGIIDKMIHAYKAPVAEADVAAIVDYLVAPRETK